jgi:hypothetical protein
MTYKTRHERRARGGKAVGSQPLKPEHGHLYNAHGSPAAEAIDEKSDGFKRGGAKKRKEGGHVEGHGAKHHMGKRARGGRAEHESKHEEKKEEERKEHKREEHDREEREERAAGGPVMRAAGGPVLRARGGGAPFSAAHKLTGPSNSKGDGPGEQADTIP